MIHTQTQTFIAYHRANILGFEEQKAKWNILYSYVFNHLKMHMSAQQGKSIHSLTHSLYCSRHASFQKLIILLLERQRHMKELSTNERKHEVKCQDERASQISCENAERGLE